MSEMHEIPVKESNFRAKVRRSLGLFPTEAIGELIVNNLLERFVVVGCGAIRA